MLLGADSLSKTYKLLRLVNKVVFLLLLFVVILFCLLISPLLLFVCCRIHTALCAYLRMIMASICQDLPEQGTALSTLCLIKYPME